MSHTFQLLPISPGGQWRADVTESEDNMNTTTYLIKLPFAKLHMRANLAEASAPIEFAIADEGTPVDDDYSPIAHQTADARHNTVRAAILCVKACGRDWWCAPTDRAKVDEVGEDAYIRELIKSVEAIDARPNAVEDCDALYDEC